MNKYERLIETNTFLFRNTYTKAHTHIRTLTQSPLRIHARNPVQGFRYQNLKFIGGHREIG